MPDVPRSESLQPGDHNGPKAAFTLVYPVWSRRAGGLSIGINLNPGKECNWACVYCEVDGLVRGTPSAVDLELLGEELDSALAQALEGHWSAPDSDVPAHIKDICIAGDGEPTLSPDFAAAVKLAARLRERHGIEASCNLVVISNGSRCHRPEVQKGLEALHGAGGELWLKVDAGTPEKREVLNGISVPTERVVESLVQASARVNTWVQTMAVHPYADTEGVARVIESALSRGAALQGILLYGLKRPSHQPGGASLRALAPEELDAAANLLRRETGLVVRVFY